MALTLSRTALLSLALGAAVIALTAPKGRRLLVSAVLVGVLVLGVVAVPSSLSRIASLADVMKEPSLQTRVLMGKSMLHMLPKYWLTGTGLAAFEEAYPAYRYPGALARVVRPHQVPLALWVEMGLAGLAAGLAIVAGLVRALLLRRASGWRAEDSAVLVALVAMLVGSLFQYFCYFEPFWLVLALVAALPRCSDATQPQGLVGEHT
jgi:O-antigen ligase